MAITFNNKEEAKEYVKFLLQEGYTPRVGKEGNKYFVSKGKYTGNPKVAGIHYNLDDEDMIVYREKPSSNIRLHELGHAFYKHGEIGYTERDTAKVEVQAETFARAMKGKDLNFETIYAIARQMETSGSKPSVILAGIEDGLHSEGFTLTRSQKSDLWNYLHYR